MAQRAGTANLPLHGGQVPKWLADRMTRLGAVIGEAIVHHYGRDELLRRLAHPFWFQSFGAVMGMDWHSSGITTSVIGALKRGLTPLEQELGIHVCGGRGKYSRQTPHELVEIGDRVGFDGAALATASRLVAKVDSAAVQDGFQLYLHGFIVTDDGHWVVVQQGMNGELKQARRYHWLSEGLKSFVDEPHAAIEGPGQGEIVILTDHRAEPSRQRQLELLGALGPDGIVRELSTLRLPMLRRTPLSQPCFLISIYPDITMFAPPMYVAKGSMAIWPRRPIARRWTFRICCLLPVWAPAPCGLWLWSPRSCTELPTASPTRLDFHSRTEGRTGIPFLCRCGFMMKQYGC